VVAVHYMTICKAAEKIASGQLSPVELVEACLQRISQFDRLLHGFVTVDSEGARAQAYLAASELRSGITRGPLHGIPVAHKDMLMTAGLRTTAHSNSLRDWVPEKDAEVVLRLRQAGAIVIGKTACHEFAYGSPGAGDAFPAARNPWNILHMPGSSSSGSGVAVAFGMAMAATGTDTGGSVRHPAAACGIVGLKPTFGRVSLEGVIPLAPSMDHVGPMTRNVADNALLLQEMTKCSDRDRRSEIRGTPDFSYRIGQSVRGLRIGIPSRYIDSVPHSSDVLHAFDGAKRIFESLGAELVDIAPPELELAPSAANVIIGVEAYRQLGTRLRAEPGKLGSALRQRLQQGATYSAEEYAGALALAKRLRLTYTAIFQSVDAVVSPGRERPAETMEELVSNPIGKRSVCNRIYSLTGGPAITLPMGLSTEGLPLGIQIAAADYCEPLVYQLAAAYEQAAGLGEFHPPELQLS
jgi:aspartyl-tRNA(Asn)/glutamyl-tRNA(Gln) amidotransferase subunit A